MCKLENMDRYLRKLHYRFLSAALVHNYCALSTVSVRFSFIYLVISNLSTGTYIAIHKDNNVFGRLY